MERSGQIIGAFLIVLGAVFLYFKSTDNVRAWISGEGESVVTTGLVVMIAVYCWIAAFGKPEMKALALAWVMVP